MTTLTLDVIGYIESPFTSKFGVPRQPGLVDSSARLWLSPPWDDPLAFRDIEGFSHLWILFHFHEIPPRERWSPLVRPPRLGGNNRVGVFASRSPYRPNPLGLSLVGNGGLIREGDRLGLVLGGGDFVDGTPVLDIKPYLPYAEALPGATGGYAQEPPPARLTIEYAPGTREALDAQELRHPGFAHLLEQMLRLDPRPQYRPGDENHVYGLPLYDCNIRWRLAGGGITVTTVEPWEDFLRRRGDE